MPEYGIDVINELVKVEAGGDTTSQASAHRSDNRNIAIDKETRDSVNPIRLLDTSPTPFY